MIVVMTTAREVVVNAGAVVVVAVADAVVIAATATNLAAAKSPRPLTYQGEPATARLFQQYRATAKKSSLLFPQLFIIGMLERSLATMQYHITLLQSEEGWSVNCPALVGCHSQGATREEAIENIKVAIREWLEVEAEEAGVIAVEETVVTV
jgi:predicted RNase H-like HicB family nuclease